MKLPFKVLFFSSAAGIISLLVACYKSEVDTTLLLLSTILGLFIRDVYPAIDNRVAGLEKVRKMINSAPSVLLKGVSVLNLSINSTANEPLPLRLYRRQTDASIGQGQDVPDSSSLRPVLIWFHGGGFVVGNFTTEDPVCSKIVLLTDFIVLSVDYRLAPENQFPSAVNDAADVLQWTRHSIEEYGGDPMKIHLSGESAGGTIAASLTALNYDPAFTSPAKKIDIRGLFILYPCLDHGVYLDSHFRYSNSFALLTLRQMQYFWSMYLPDQAIDAADYRACPLRTPVEILKKFPRSLIVLAKHDILLDEGLKFAKRLTDSEVFVETMVYERMLHGFFTKSGNETQTVEICDRLNDMVAVESVVHY